jgi:hypothetical protein
MIEVLHITNIDAHEFPDSRMTHTRLSSAVTTPRSSIELAKQAYRIEIPSITTKLARSHTSSRRPKSSIWSSIKRYAREHHKIVSAVYTHYYGQGLGRRVGISAEGVRVRGGNREETSEPRGARREIWRYEKGVYGRS